MVQLLSDLIIRIKQRVHVCVCAPRRDSPEATIFFALTAGRCRLVGRLQLGEPCCKPPLQPRHCDTKAKQTFCTFCCDPE